MVAQQLEFDFAQFLPDGTGDTKRPSKPGGSNRGELKMMIGVDDKGNTYPMGVWSDKSWAEIGTAILDPEEAEEGPPTGIGLGSRWRTWHGRRARACQVDGVERCHWHLSRDLGHSMWQDDAPLGEGKIKAKKLRQLIAIKLPNGAVDEISEEEKAKLLERCNQVDR